MKKKPDDKKTKAKGAGRPKEENLKMVALKDIDEPAIAVRSSMNREKLDTLMRSIENVGLLQPVVLKKVGKRYEIIVGHRRLTAFMELKRDRIPARVFEGEREAKAEIAKLHENLEREDINALDEARFIFRINKKYDLNQGEIAKQIGRSEGYVSQRLAIMAAPQVVQDALEDGVISFSVARELAQIDDDIELNQLLHFAVENGITPNVARSWRMQYEARKLTSPGQAADEFVPPPADDGGGHSSFECETCFTRTATNKMKILRVCPDCHGTVRKSSSAPPQE